MTRARKHILDILTSSEVPLSAQDIEQRKTIEMNSVTVYRTLHYLEAHEYCDSFPLTCSEHGTERYYAAVHHRTDGTCDHHHWFHCIECHRFIDLGTCRIDELIAGYEKELSVSVVGHSLSLTGVCERCLQTRDHSGNQEHQGPPQAGG